MRLPSSKLNLLLFWVASYTLEVTTSYVIHPSGGQGRQNLNGQSETTITSKESSPFPFQCLQVTTKIDPTPKGSNDDKKTAKAPKLDYEPALSELFKNFKNDSARSSNKQNGLAILFISAEWAPYLQNIAKDAQERYIGSDSKLITVVGGGIIGGGKEVQDSPSMSFFGGILPKGSNANVFHGSDGKDEKDGHIMISALNKVSFSHDDGTNENCDNNRRPSTLLFADQFCMKLHDVMDEFGNDIVAGGISIGDKNQPSIAIGKKVLPTGSFAGISFQGNVGLQVVVSHGCRPVGPTYRVTSVKGAAVHKLNGESAFERLQDTIRTACKKDQDLFNSLGVLCGVHHNFQQGDDDATQALDNGGSFEDTNDEKYPEDFILREVNGFRPRSGSILVCGQPQIQKGDYVRFHVRSSETALQDWESVLKRVRTERMFLGNNQVGSPLGAIQISCMGRGTGLFDDDKNVDLNHVQQLLDHNNHKDDKDNRVPPIAGMFANAEIGPVRLRMGTPSGTPNQMKGKQLAYLHGYSTVVAMICDYSKMEDPNSIEELMMPELSCLGNSTFDSSVWE